MFDLLSQESRFLVVGWHLALGFLMGFWILYSRKNRWSEWTQVAPALALAGLVLLKVVFFGAVDADESEHLVVSDMLRKGWLPFRDLEQNHSPLLWMLIAPCLNFLPNSPGVLLLFRFVMLLAFFLSVYLVWSSTLAHLPDREPMWAPLCILAACAQAVPGEVFRVRPDPLMNLTILAAFAVLLRVPTRATWSFGLVGALMGLSLAFSPKSIPLVALGPICLVAGYRCTRVRVRALLAWILGLGSGILPVVLWLASKGLLEPAWSGIFLRNLDWTVQLMTDPAPGQISSANSFLDKSRAFNIGPYMTLSAIGAVMLTTRRNTSWIKKWLPGIAWVLALAAWPLAGNRLTYHVAGALILASGLVPLALAKLWNRTHSTVSAVCLGILVSLLTGNAPFRAGIQGHADGASFPIEDLLRLHREVERRGGDYLGIVPIHPIFTETPSPTYLRFHQSPRHWCAGIAWALEETPGVLQDPPWDRIEMARRCDEDVGRLRELLTRDYVRSEIGSETFWLERLEGDGKSVSFEAGIDRDGMLLTVRHGHAPKGLAEPARRCRHRMNIDDSSL